MEDGHNGVQQSRDHQAKPRQSSRTHFFFIPSGAKGSATRPKPLSRPHQHRAGLHACATHRWQGAGRSQAAGARLSEEKLIFLRGNIHATGCAAGAATAERRERMGKTICGQPLLPMDLPVVISTVRGCRDALQLFCGPTLARDDLRRCATRLVPRRRAAGTLNPSDWRASDSWKADGVCTAY